MDGGDNLFDFGTDPALVEAADACTHGETHASDTVEGETTRGIAPAVATPSASPGSVVEWREVPAALFLSWSAARQFSYCAARDEDSARQAYTEVEAEWYRQRAQHYKEIQWS